MSEQSLLQNKEYYLLSGFPETALICATSSRYQGNMSLIYGETKDALKNRKDFLKELGIDYEDLVCPRQIHDSKVSYITEKERGRGALNYDTAIADTDALVTDIKRLPLSIFTADCLPIFLYDLKKHAVGLAHTGWRGTKKNIVAKTLQSMEKYFHTRMQDLLVGFGPSIRSCCYVVDRDFENFFSMGLIKRSQDYYLDLVQINSQQVLDFGVPSSNIFDCQICTSCHREEFFSYRREGKSCGRMMSVAMLL